MADDHAEPFGARPKEESLMEPFRREKDNDLRKEEEALGRGRDHFRRCSSSMGGAATKEPGLLHQGGSKEPEAGEGEAPRPSIGKGGDPDDKDQEGSDENEGSDEDEDEKKQNFWVPSWLYRRGESAESSGSEEGSEEEQQPEKPAEKEVEVSDEGEDEEEEELGPSVAFGHTLSNLSKRSNPSGVQLVGRIGGARVVRQTVRGSMLPTSLPQGPGRRTVLVASSPEEGSPAFQQRRARGERPQVRQGGREPSELVGGPATTRKGATGARNMGPRSGGAEKLESSRRPASPAGPRGSVRQGGARGELPLGSRGEKLVAGSLLKGA